MASIEINFNIMSHHGNKDREHEVLPQEREDEGKREQGLNYEPRNLFPIQNSIRSEISVSIDPKSGAFDPPRHVMFGGNTSSTRNVDYSQRIHNDHSGELPGSEIGFENQRSSTLDHHQPPQPLMTFNDGDSFAIGSIENITDELRTNPLINLNEPINNFQAIQDFEGNNFSDTFAQNSVDESTVSAVVPNRFEKQYILSMYAHGSYTPQTNDEDMDQKPAAVDRTLLHNQQQQYCHPSQQFMYPTQASNLAFAFHPNTNRSMRDQVEEEKELDERKPPPEASVTRESDRSPQETRKARLNHKPPPAVSLLAQGNRRSSRITALATRNESKKEKGHSSMTKIIKSKTRAGSKTKVKVKRKSSSKKIFTPTPKQLGEARTKRKMKALLTWFDRFRELVKFIDDNKHGKVFDLC